MLPAPSSDRELDAYREQADRFIAELDEEFYLHYAGLKESFDLAPIYERHANYLELYRKALPSSALDDLAEQCRHFLDSTQQLYEDAADKLFRARVGVSLGDAERWDVPRLFRAPEWDAMFPADRMVPALESTLADLGIDLQSQKNVTLDLEERPNKSPRAFCAPIEVPDRVVLVIQPIGGPDDWRALFHEGGHTEHFAHTSRDLSMDG